MIDRGDGGGSLTVSQSTANYSIAAVNALSWIGVQT